MLNLPVITCDDCGACCLEIGTPPYVGHEIYELPESLRDEVLERLKNDPNRENSKLPCYWYDLETKKCTQYEHRPAVCKDFEIGCTSCLSYRRYHNINVEAFE